MQCKIDGGSMSFWAVVNNTEGDSGGLRLLERMRIKMWLKRAFAEIAKADVKGAFLRELMS